MTRPKFARARARVVSSEIRLHQFSRNIIIYKLMRMHATADGNFAWQYVQSSLSQATLSPSSARASFSRPLYIAVPQSLPLYPIPASSLPPSISSSVPCMRVQIRGIRIALSRPSKQNLRSTGQKIRAISPPLT